MIHITAARTCTHNAIKNTPLANELRAVTERLFYKYGLLHLGNANESIAALFDKYRLLHDLDNAANEFSAAPLRLSNEKTFVVADHLSRKALSVTGFNLTRVPSGGSALSSKPRTSMEMMFAMRHYHSFGARQSMELIKTNCKHVNIDTLALAVKLKDKGKIDENLTRAIIETIMQVYHASNHNASNLYVLKSEMEKLLSAFETEVKRSQVESDQGLRALLDEIKSDSDKLRVQLESTKKSDSDKLRVQLESTKLDIVKYCTGTLVSLATLAIALLQYLSKA